LHGLGQQRRRDADEILYFLAAGKFLAHILHLPQQGRIAILNRAEDVIAGAWRYSAMSPALRDTSLKNRAK
jgi:hypothetical protein